MSIDRTNAHQLITANELCERWIETIRTEHESARGSVDTFESGFEAFRSLLITYSSYRRHGFFERMIAGEVSAEEVASDYRTNVLDPGLDRIVPLENGAYKMALPQGYVAVAPHSMRHDPAITGAILTYLCRSYAPDYRIPRIMMPMPYLINNMAVGPIDIADRTFVGGISIWEDANVLHVEGVDGEKLAEIPFSYPFEREVMSIDDPVAYLMTWNQYLKDVLGIIASNFFSFESSLPSGIDLFGEIPKHAEMRFIEPVMDVFPSLKRTLQLIEVTERVFGRNYSFANTWLSTFVRTQAAEFNNNGSPIMTGMEFIKGNEFFLQYYRWIAKSFRAFTDPVKHVEKSFAAIGVKEPAPNDVSYWLDVSFEEGSVTREGEIIPSNGITLRMMLDEIVFQAGEAWDGRAHEITFFFESGRVVIKDKGMRGALDYYYRDGEARSRLEEQAKSLGKNGRIQFHRGILANVIAIEIAFDLENNSHLSWIERCGGNVSFTTSSSAGEGFAGIVRSETAERARNEEAAGNLIGSETYLDSAISDPAHPEEERASVYTTSLAAATAAMATIRV